MSDLTSVPSAKQSGGAIERRSLHLVVSDRVRDMIIEGQLPPGQKVPERELCEQLGVSRTPLREALKVLSQEGLIEPLPNRGSKVVEISDRTVEELFDVLAALEGQSGECACVNMTDAEIIEVRGIHNQMIMYFKNNDLPGYFKLNRDIHNRIMAGSGNRALKKIYDGVASRIYHARYTANHSPARWSEAIAEHEQIMQLLEARDGARLGQLLRQHVRNKREALRVAKNTSETSHPAGLSPDTV